MNFNEFSVFAAVPESVLMKNILFLRYGKNRGAGSPATNSRGQTPLKKTGGENMSKAVDRKIQDAQNLEPVANKYRGDLAAAGISPAPAGKEKRNVKW